MNETTPSWERREFLAGSSAVGAGLIASSLIIPGQAKAANTNELKIGLIGCGGRGSGAADQTLSVGNCKLVAMGDAHEDRLSQSYSALKGKHGDRVDVPDEHKFIGFDAFQKVIELSDMVILATPPGFRPFHFQAAVEAGKNVFMEKPVAVDSHGVRLVVEAAKKADEKNLKVVVGLQRRYQKSYIEAHAKVQEGIIGQITAAQVYWNNGGVWVKERLDGMTEMQYQMRNWYYFNWLCGDHIAEQHIHNLDVANWFIGSYPVTAQGMGGRQVRTEKIYGEIYDHHYVEYRYANDVIVNSQCRHIRGCNNEVREEFHGSKGHLYLSPGSAKATDLDGKEIWSYRGRDDGNPYQVEHDELHKAIREDLPLNNAYYGAYSTFTSVLGRYCTYSGKKLSWDEMLKAEIRTMPENIAWDANPPTLPDKDGVYPIAQPGTWKPI